MWDAESSINDKPDERGGEEQRESTTIPSSKILAMSQMQHLMWTSLACETVVLQKEVHTIAPLQLLATFVVNYYQYIQYYIVTFHN